MRWTRKLRLTSATDADGEDVWSRHPDAGVKFPGKQNFFGDDGGKNSPVTEESAL